MSGSGEESSATASAGRVPLLSTTGGGGNSGVGYAAWRPQMEAALLRAGIEVRDYKEEIKEWAKLEKALQQDIILEEDFGMALVLAGSEARTAKREQEEKAADPQLQEVKARKSIADRVRRVRRAYVLLYTAMPEELRLLTTDVPQGYAFGLWDWLQKRFQNTEQDSVADHWEQFTGLNQTAEETFEEYKARVDAVKTLLEQAKEVPSAGQYSHRLLWKLHSRYSQAVLALKAGDMLKDINRVDWTAVASFMSNYERSQLRLTGENSGGDRSMAARSSSHSSSSSGSKQGAPLSWMKCFSCGETGHFKRNCKNRKQQNQGGWKQQKGRHNKNRREPGSGSDDEGGEGRSSGYHRQEQAQAAYKYENGRGNRYESLSENEEEEDEKGKQQSAAGRSHQPMGRSYAAVAYSATPAVEQKTFKRLRTLRAVEEENKKKAEAAKPIAKPFGSVSPSVSLPKSAMTVKTSVKPLNIALATNSWGFDTMASVHCTGNRDALFNLKRCPPLSIEVADGAVVTTSHCGSVGLRMAAPGKDKPVAITIHNVYYHERFSANLMSWGTLRQEGWELHSASDSTYTVTPGKTRVPLSTRGRVLVLDHAVTERVYGVRGQITITTADEVLRLHERLGHVSFNRLVQICEKNKTDGVGRINMDAKTLAKAKGMVMDCPACAQGKGSRTPVGHRGLDRGRAPGEVLHMDTFFVSLRGRDGTKYMEYCLVAVDPISEYRWTVVAQKKDDIPSEAEAIVRHCQTMTGNRVKRVYSDGGGEFIDRRFREFCRQNGTEAHHSPPATPKMNGIAEANVQTSKDAARTMLMHAHLEEAYWRRAVLHHTYLWNRTRVGRETGMTPIETMTGRKPNAMYLGVFGCDVFVHRPKEKRDTTFSAKMEPGVYLGHDPRQNCPIVHLLSSGKPITTRDVDFREGSFRHSQALRSGTVGDILREGYQSAAEQPLSAGIKEQFRSSEKETDIDEDDAEDTAMNTEKQYEVEGIVDKRQVNGETEYQIRWVGYADPTWEPVSGLTQVPDMIKQFEASRAPPVSASAPPPAQGSGGRATRSSTRARATAALAVEQREQSSDTEEEEAANTAKIAALATHCVASRL
jgi:transposase InsO family protein